MSAAAAPKAKAAPRSAPVDLETIKDDLGIPADDTSSDAWLTRRIDGLWSRFQSYTGRPLTLASGWVDDWGELFASAPARLEPPSVQPMPRGSVYLRVFPVVAISKVTINGATLDPTKAIFEPASGKLFSLDGPPAIDLGVMLVSGRARLEYTAGFNPLPADLYDALLGALAIQWSARQAIQANGGGLLPTRISAIDVGDVEFSTAPNAIVEATMKGVGTEDPLLGPYAMLLDPYVDYRSILSAGTLPTTAPLPAPP
jgi:hypothetical protein